MRRVSRLCDTTNVQRDAGALKKMAGSRHFVAIKVSTSMHKPYIIEHRTAAQVL